MAYVHYSFCPLRIGTIKKGSLLEVFILYTFGWGTFRGVLHCAFALLRRCLWYCISVSFLYSLCWKFQNLHQLFYRCKILRDETFLWHLTEFRHWALWKSWKYIRQISSSYLICTPTGGLASGISVSLVFFSILNSKNDTPGGWPLVLVMCRKILDAQFKQHTFSIC